MYVSKTIESGQEAKGGEKKESIVQTEKDGLGCGSVVKHLPGMCKSLGSLTRMKKEKRRWRKEREGREGEKRIALER